MHLDLRQLEVFCRVVEKRSFTLAGSDLGLAQATVSERIAALESTVGLRLLDRLGRSAVPTRAGEKLYDRALHMLRLRDELLADLAGYGTDEAGTLEIAASTIPGEFVLPELTARFRKDRPRVLVRVKVGDSHWVGERVLAGEVECGVVGAEPDAPNLDAKALWPDALVAIAPPDHPLAHARAIPRDLLLEQPLILREPGSGTRRTLENALGPRAADLLRVVAEFGSTTAAKRAVAAGHGISVLSAVAVEQELRAGTLVQLDVQPPLPVRRLWAITDRRRAPSPLCRAFLCFLEADAASRAPSGQASRR